MAKNEKSNNLMKKTKELIFKENLQDDVQEPVKIIDKNKKFKLTFGFKRYKDFEFFDIRDQRSTKDDGWVYTGKGYAISLRFFDDFLEAIEIFKEKYADEIEFWRDYEKEIGDYKRRTDVSNKLIRKKKAFIEKKKQEKRKKEKENYKKNESEKLSDNAL